MAGRRCVLEFCGGAGGVLDSGEPGRGGDDGGLRAGATALCGNLFGIAISGGATVADAGFWEFHDGNGVVRGVDGGVNGGVAIHGEQSDGTVEEGNGVGAEHARE